MSTCALLTVPVYIYSCIAYEHGMVAYAFASGNDRCQSAWACVLDLAWRSGICIRIDLLHTWLVARNDTHSYPFQSLLIFPCRRAVHMLPGRQEPRCLAVFLLAERPEYLTFEQTIQLQSPAEYGVVQKYSKVSSPASQVIAMTLTTNHVNCC
jgi:hypothetical protein